MKRGAASLNEAPSIDRPDADHAPTHALRCFKLNGRHSVWLIHRPGESPRIRKVWPITLWSLCKVCIGLAQPQRQQRGARRLRLAGFRTPDIVQPLRIDLRRRIMTLELEYIEGPTALALLRDARVGQAGLTRCAAAIGALVPSIADARLFNRDLKLSNLIAHEHQGEWTIWIIDPVGVRSARNRLEELTRMLHRLASEPVVQNLDVPRAMVITLLLHALRPLSEADRREVIRRLRQHRPH